MKKKKITINDFTPVIPWEQVEQVFVYHLGKRDGAARYRKFQKWMSGQTCTTGGVYPWDLARFLEGLPIID